LEKLKNKKGMKLKKKSQAFFLLFILGFILVFFFIFRKGRRISSPSLLLPEDTSRLLQETVLPVRVVSARRKDLEIELSLPGEAVAFKKIIIRTEVPGKIRRLNVEESQYVEKGELLVELEDEEYRLELERTEAMRLKVLSELVLEGAYQPKDNEGLSFSPDIQKKMNEFEKLKNFYQEGLISEQEFRERTREFEISLIDSGMMNEEVRAASKGLTQTEIEVRRASLNLEKTKISAPFSGVVTEIRVFPGEYVSAGSELLTLVDILKIQIHAKAIESEAGKIKMGSKARLRFIAYPRKIFLAKVKAISPFIDPQEKTCRVILEVDNPGEEIKPGMHAEIEITVETHKSRLLLPQDAILFREGRNVVFVIEGNLAKWRYVKTGIENQEYVEILEGIKEGELVAVEGHLTLAHDARVRIID